MYAYISTHTPYTHICTPLPHPSNPSSSSSSISFSNIKSLCCTHILHFKHHTTSYVMHHDHHYFKRQCSTQRPSCKTSYIVVHTSKVAVLHWSQILIWPPHLIQSQRLRRPHSHPLQHQLRTPQSLHARPHLDSASLERNQLQRPQHSQLRLSALKQKQLHSPQPCLTPLHWFSISWLCFILDLVVLRELRFTSRLCSAGERAENRTQVFCRASRIHSQWHSVHM